MLYGFKNSYTAVFRGNSSDYVVEFDAVSWSYRVVDKVAGRGGSDHINSIEKLQFADGTLNFADWVRAVPMSAQFVHEGSLAIGFVTSFGDSVELIASVSTAMEFTTSVTTEDAVSLIGIVEANTGSHFGMEFCAML